MNKTESLRPKTRQEIADELYISYSTFKRWLKKQGISLPRGLVLPCYQKLIYDKFYNRIEE